MKFLPSKPAHNYTLTFQQFPQITIQTNSLVKIAQCQQFQIGDIDVGIIPVNYAETSLIQHHLFDMVLRVYASPQYLQLHSIPKSLEDLNEHKLIVYSGVGPETLNSHLIDSNTQNLYGAPSLIVDSGLSMYNALINGLGIGCYAYDKKLVENNQLIDIFPNIQDQKIPYYYTYHRRLQETPKVQVFYEFMKKVVKDWQRPL